MSKQRIYEPVFQVNIIHQHLRKRLLARGTETEDSLKKRLDTAEKEMAYGEQESNFDKVIVNDDLERAYQELKEFIEPAVQQMQKVDDTQ